MKKNAYWRWLLWGSIGLMAVLPLRGKEIYIEDHLPRKRIVDEPHVRIWVKNMFSLEKRMPFHEFEDSYGVVFRDLNNDHWADIYVIRFREFNRLFINQKEKNTFREFTIESGLGGSLQSQREENLELGTSAVDFNNDGKQDVLICGWDNTTFLFKQTNSLTFTPIRPLEEGVPLDGNGGSWADVDRDGKLDLFITDEHHKNHLLLNKGGDEFEDVTEQFGLYAHWGAARSDSADTSQGAAFADVDGDNYPDLYVCNWFTEDVLYRNVKGEQFVRVQLPLPHLEKAINSNSVSFGDIDNDGDLDMLVSDREGKSRLYQNHSHPCEIPWKFKDITEVAGLNNSFPAYGSVIADLNNDGWQDIFFSNTGPNQLFLNAGSGMFDLAYEELFPVRRNHLYYSTGAAVADYDNDGDLDLFTANKDTASILFRNPSEQPGIRIQIEGVISNRDAIGTKVWLYQQSSRRLTPKIAGYREIAGGSAYLSFSESIVHFGGADSLKYWAKIRFPSGIETTIHGLKPGGIFHVTEVGGIHRAVRRAFHRMSLLVQEKDFWLHVFLFLIVLVIVGGFLLFSIHRYNWQNKQSALFLMSALILSSGLFWLLFSKNATTILLAQIITLVVLLPGVIALMEKIRQIEIERFGYRQVLRKFSYQLIFIKNNIELYEKLTLNIQQVMKVRFCSVVDVSSGHTQYQLVAGQWEQSEIKIALSEESMKQLLLYPIIRSPMMEELVPELIGMGVELLVPLARKEKLLAFLVMGKRQNDKEYHAEDLALLEILAGQAAVAIENNLYIEKSKALIQKITEGEIRERYVRELEQKNETLENLYHELKETQAQLIQSVKMASLGQLVAGIAHELNNPISFIYANLKELKLYSKSLSKLLEVLSGFTRKKRSGSIPRELLEAEKKYDLEFIRSDMGGLIEESLLGSQRVKDLVKDLRNFSRLDEAEYKIANLEEGLDSTLCLLKNEFKNRIEVHRNYGKIPSVYCNPGQMNQVFMNLLLNAGQAVKENGEIWITTKCIEEKWIVISIRDSGTGISENIRDKIFDPFFTTKAVGVGTGLGLSISYGILRNHDGKITVEGRDGEGAIFKIFFPLKQVSPKVLQDSESVASSHSSE